MIIYNVTISLDSDVEKAWKAWMLAKHIPDVMATGFFESFELLHLLDPLVDPASVTYCVQYRCLTLLQFETYRDEFATALRQEHEDRYKGRFIAFRTILETMDG